MRRQALVIVVIVLGFGILVPWYKGIAFLDPRLLLAYGCIAMLFAAPASADAAAAHRAGGSGDSLIASLARIVAFGWGVTVLILVTGVVTVNVTYWRGDVLKPSYALFFGVLAFSLAAAALVAGTSGMLARRLTANGVRGVIRIVFLAVLLLFVFSSRLPDRWQLVLAEYSTRRAITRLAWEAAAVCAAAAAVLFILLRAPRTAPQSATMSPNPIEEEDEQRR